MTDPLSLFGRLDDVDSEINQINLQIAITGGNANLTAWLDYLTAEQAAIIAALPTLGVDSIDGHTGALTFEGAGVDITYAGGAFTFTVAAVEYSGLVLNQLVIGQGADSIASVAQLLWNPDPESLTVEGELILEGDFSIEGFIIPGTYGFKNANAPVQFWGSDQANYLYLLVDDVNGSMYCGMTDGVDHSWNWGTPYNTDFSVDYGWHLQYNTADQLAVSTTGVVTLDSLDVLGAINPSEFHGDVTVDGSLTAAGGFTINGGVNPVFATANTMTDMAAAVTLAPATNAPTGVTGWNYYPFNDNGVTRYLVCVS